MPKRCGGFPGSSQKCRCEHLIVAGAVAVEQEEEEPLGHGRGEWLCCRSSRYWRFLQFLRPGWVVTSSAQSARCFQVQILDYVVVIVRRAMCRRTSLAFFCARFAADFGISVVGDTWTTFSG